MFATSRQNNEDKISSYYEHSIRKPYYFCTSNSEKANINI